jgi:excisionase family DNA binding protein
MQLHLNHLPKPQEMAEAKQFIKQLEQHKNLRLQLGDSSFDLPENLTDLLKEILIQTVQGNRVAVLPLQNELSSIEAAAQLNVSRQWLINEAEAGRIRMRKIGSHRRFLLRDVLEFAATLEQESLEARQILAEEAQRLGLD